MIGENKWTAEECKALLGWHKSGLTAKSLMEFFGRTEQAIQKMAVRRGVKLGAYKGNK